VPQQVRREPLAHPPDRRLHDAGDGRGGERRQRQLHRELQADLQAGAAGHVRELVDARGRGGLGAAGRRLVGVVDAHAGAVLVGGEVHALGEHAPGLAHQPGLHHVADL